MDPTSLALLSLIGTLLGLGVSLIALWGPNMSARARAVIGSIGVLLVVACRVALVFIIPVKWRSPVVLRLPFTRKADMKPGAAPPMSVPTATANLGANSSVQLRLKYDLAVDRRMHVVKIKVSITNKGEKTAEEVGAYGGAVFGSDNDYQMVSGVEAPSRRLNPGETSTIAFVQRADLADDLLKRLDKHERLDVALTLFFMIDGVQYTQRGQAGYIYQDKIWDIEEDQVFRGMMAFPVAVFSNGLVIRPPPLDWLPTPTAATP